MKDSGGSWLGDVPEHWTTVRLKSSMNNIVEQTTERRGSDLYVALEHVESWTGRLRHAGLDVSFDSQVKYFRSGDILFGKLRPYLAKVTRPTSDGVCVGEFLVLRPRHSNATAPYMEQLLRSKPIIDAVNSSTFGAKMPRAEWQFMGGMAIVHPPLPEQAAIVRFLDHVDRRIRSYIRAKHKLITLLEEQKQAIIHQAVTGQVDVRTGQPYPAYKPSGVEWLGDVPEHWEVRRLKWVTRLQRGYDLPADRRVPGPFPVVSSGGFIDTHLESRCAGPGVVMGRYGSTDAVFYVEQDFWPHNTSLFVTHFQGNTQKWCYYLLRSITKADHAGKSAVPGLDRNDLFQIVVPVPPVDEQREVVRTIEVATHDLNDAISAARREIDLLREYRTRLIADVVTGKLDVRESAAQLPDEVEEPEPLDQANTLIGGEEEPTDELDTTTGEAAV